MLSVESIIINKCRLCYNQPGCHKLSTNKSLMKEISESMRVKVNDESKDLLPHSICDECKKTVQNFGIFKQHIRKIDQKLRQLLIQAENNCENLSTLDLACNQESTHNLNENVTCPGCNEIFHDADQQRSHKCANDVEKRANDVCLRPRKKKEFEGKNTVFGSYKIGSGEIHKQHALSTVCDTCNETFDSKRDLKSHKKMHKMGYICRWKDCKKVLNSAYTLKTHQLIHEGKRSFLCVMCGKGFITKNSLTCHEKIHLEVKGYNCKLCNIGFSVRSNLRAHEKKYHEGIRFYCSQCTKAFVSKCSLERHEKIHTGVKEFQCETCPSAFYTNKELLKHQRYHQGLRLHKCDECFKTFFERHHLITHVRSHTGERPYVCKVPNCGKAFMESQKLKRHHSAKHIHQQ